MHGPFLAIALLFSPPTAVAETLTYRLTPKFGDGRVRVEITWETQGRTQSTLSVPPRFGQIDDVPALLERVAIDGASRTKRDGGMWIMTHAKGAILSVTYEVNAKRTSFSQWDDMHRPIAAEDVFCGIGSTFLLAPNTQVGQPATFDVTLTWALRAGNVAVCSWGGARRAAAAQLTAADIRQSVYMAGALSTKTQKFGVANVTVAMPDGFGFSIDEFSRMTGTIIEKQCAFMDEKAFPDFVVTALPVGPPLKEGQARIAGSGLYNSFALFVAPQTPWSDAIEHLFAHELFHFWLGRTLAASEPEKLCYWFIEGFTDYYALRILYESKHWSAATYAKWLNKHLGEYAENPARNASNQEINEKYWEQRDTIGQVAYQRGHLLGLRWQDLAKKKGVSTGIDKLFFPLIQRGRSGANVSNDSIRKAGVELLGKWFDDEFDRHVTNAATVEVPPDALAPALEGRIEEVSGRGGKKLQCLQFHAP